MLKRTSGGDNDTELNELTVAPIRVPSFITVVTTATPVGKSPRASRKLRSVKVIWRALFLWQADSPMFVQLSPQSKRLCARRKLSGVYETRYSICLIGHSRDDSQKLLVGVDAGPTALEHSRAGLLLYMPKSSSVLFDRPNRLTSAWDVCAVTLLLHPILLAIQVEEASIAALATALKSDFASLEQSTQQQHG
jgi:hypothetical protein